ncbi:hypothetical protein GLOTRDRAFT_94362 [Gloeophyllum trabeum ATCC 11539]|uniref:Uncharacterized protein n=1 Tax=Gloeophyllum trabeum (strain ATCC 11539 / FP-39264 / Madison 617) TaxID=670483 RepID=S7RI43_GLOTA|nr:uncharacterized protein GLOTRDRAFT_94362 [Gloeophyllum trabeum ATCC 11539]EPQ53950.1 hypothetical protein GLOTRDRAFT_94362 [Gloeophyllum trabeum ATCC 11539]
MKFGHPIRSFSAEKFEGNSTELRAWGRHVPPLESGSETARTLLAVRPEKTDDLTPSRGEDPYRLVERELCDVKTLSPSRVVRREDRRSHPARGAKIRPIFVDSDCRGYEVVDTAWGCQQCRRVGQREGPARGAKIHTDSVERRPGRSIKGVQAARACAAKTDDLSPLAGPSSIPSWSSGGFRGGSRQQGRHQRCAENTLVDNLTPLAGRRFVVSLSARAPLSARRSTGRDGRSRESGEVEASRERAMQQFVGHQYVRSASLLNRHRQDDGTARGEAILDMEEDREREWLARVTENGPIFVDRDSRGRREAAATAGHAKRGTQSEREHPTSQVATSRTPDIECRGRHFMDREREGQDPSRHCQPGLERLSREAVKASREPWGERERQDATRQMKVVSRSGAAVIAVAAMNHRLPDGDERAGVHVAHGSSDRVNAGDDCEGEKRGKKMSTSQQTGGRDGVRTLLTGRQFIPFLLTGGVNGLAKGSKYRGIAPHNVPSSASVKITSQSGRNSRKYQEEWVLRNFARKRVQHAGIVSEIAQAIVTDAVSGDGADGSTKISLAGCSSSATTYSKVNDAGDAGAELDMRPTDWLGYQRMTAEMIQHRLDGRMKADDVGKRRSARDHQLVVRQKHTYIPRLSSEQIPGDRRKHRDADGPPDPGIHMITSSTGEGEICEPLHWKAHGWGKGLGYLGRTGLKGHTFASYKQNGISDRAILSPSAQTEVQSATEACQRRRQTKDAERNVLNISTTWDALPLISLVQWRSQSPVSLAALLRALANAPACCLQNRCISAMETIDQGSGGLPATMHRRAQAGLAREATVYTPFTEALKQSEVRRSCLLPKRSLTQTPEKGSTSPSSGQALTAYTLMGERSVPGSNSGVLRLSGCEQIGVVRLCPMVEFGPPSVLAK